MLTDKQVEQLSADLPREAVESRTQSGVTLSYVPGHYCIRRANEIFGFGGWRRETRRLTLVREVPEYAGKDGKVGYYCAYVAHVRIHVRVGEEWVATDGIGYGESVTYLQAEGQAHESASKEAETDAMKRALICWGDQFGLALYSRDQEHVEGDAPRQQSRSGSRAPAPAQGGEDYGPPPACPECGRPCKLRHRKSDGKAFWGCSGYPDCTGIVKALAAGQGQLGEASEDDPFGDQ